MRASIWRWLLMFALLSISFSPFPTHADDHQPTPEEIVAKIDPRLRDLAHSGSQGLVLVDCIVQPGVDLMPLFERALLRPSLEPFGPRITGYIRADRLSKLASSPSVQAVMATGFPRPEPYPASLTQTNNEEQALLLSDDQAWASGWFEKDYVGWETAWANGFTGNGVFVAVLDDGVDFGHPDLMGKQARITDSESPYYVTNKDGEPMGWPIVVDAWSMLWYVLDPPDEHGNWGFYVNTRTALPISSAQTVVFDDVLYTVPATSKTNLVRMGYHPDRALASLYGEPVAILLADEGRADLDGNGQRDDYDTVYVDLNHNRDFTDDKPCTIGDEISWWDSDGNGYPNLSGGMIYFIADGAHHIPTMDYLFPDTPPPAKGDMICFAINDVGRGGSHGTLCASNVASRGIIDGSGPGRPVWKTPGDGTPGTGMVQAGGKDTLVIATGDFYAGGALLDWYQALMRGYDGVPDGDFHCDDAQIISQSFGSGYTDMGGWDYLSRAIAEMNTKLNPHVTLVDSTGNGGPGYGTVNSPHPPTGVHVAASTQYAYTGPGADPFLSRRQCTYGDFQGLSNRGPGALGDTGVTVMANGGWGTGDVPVNMLYGGDSWNAWTMWAGTSRAAPVVAAVLSLIYDAYTQAHGGCQPTYDEARDLLMAGATYTGEDPFTAGAGLVSAANATALAAGLPGIRISPAHWEAGDYAGVQYPGFPHLLHPGEASEQTFTLYNPGPEDQVVFVRAGHLVEIGDPITGTLRTADRWQESSFNPGRPDYLVRIPKAQIPEETRLMIARLAQPLDTFDTDYSPGDPTSYVPPGNNVFSLIVYNWWDANADGNLWTDSNGNGCVNSNEIDYGEYNRFGEAENIANGQEVRVHDPLGRVETDIYLGVFHSVRALTIPTATLHYEARFYGIQDWDRIHFLGEDQERELVLTVPAGDSISFTAALRVPEEYSTGLYGGHIFVRDSRRTTAVPVVVNVAGTIRQPLVLGGAAAGRPYDNSQMHGLGSDKPESGDWRTFFMDQSEQPPAGTLLAVHSTWQGAPPNDVDTLIFGPKADAFSASNPTFFGPHGLAQVGGSARVTVGDRPHWVFDTNSGGSEDWIFAPLSRGLHMVRFQNVLFGGESISLPFRADVGTVQLEPLSLRFPDDSPVGTIVTLNLQSSMEFPQGIEVRAYGLSPDLTEMLTWESSYANIIREYSLSGAGLLEFATYAHESTVADVDLHLWRWDESQSTWEKVASSSNIAAEESIRLLTPPDGLYRLEVVNFAHQPGHVMLHVRRPQGTGIAAQDVPDGSIHAGQMVTITIRLDQLLSPGNWEGCLFLGPAGAWRAIEVPVRCVVTQQWPTIFLPIMVKSAEQWPW